MPKVDVPKAERPKVPIEAIRPPTDRARRPLGRNSLISTSPAGLKTKPAYSVKSSLLG